MPRTVRKAVPEWEQVFTGTIPKEVGATNASTSEISNTNFLLYPADIAYSHHIIQNIVCNVQIRNLTTIDITRLHKDFGMTSLSTLYFLLAVIVSVVLTHTHRHTI